MQKWVTTWGNAEAPSEQHEQVYAKNLTLRYVIPVMTDGSKIRLYFSNKYTDEKVVISSVTIGKNVDFKVDSTNRSDKTTDIKKVTFNKKSKCKLAKGDAAYSDEIDYPVSKGDMLSVSMYLKDYTNLSTGTVLMGRYSFGFCADGNCVYEESMPLYTSMDTSKTYLLYGVDVLTDADKGAIVCFGDSITAQFWTDEFSYLMLNSSCDMSVVRKAIGGSRIFRRYLNKANVNYGEAGVKRFDDNLASVSGAKAVVILHGINDIIHPDGSVYRPMEMLPSAEEIINAYENKYIATARRNGLKVYFGTILPFKGWRTYTDERDAIRQDVNAWIRSTDKIDGYIDFDALVKADDDNKIKDGFTVDGIHPTLQGASVMAKAVFEKLSLEYSNNDEQ